MTSRRISSNARHVIRIRNDVRSSKAIVFAIVLLALLVRLVVPAGFMPSFSTTAITITLCTGSSPSTQVIALPGHGNHRGDEHRDHGKSEMPCGFSGLGAPGLSGADPIQIALAIAFICAAVFRVVTLRPFLPPTYLRPPLRGPPHTA